MSATTTNPAAANAPSADDQVARIFAWRRGFNTIFLIDVGVKLGLFKAIAAKPDRTAAELAGELGLHVPYVSTWCRTCYGMEILEVVDADVTSGARFRLAPHMDTILASPGHPRYLGGFIDLATGTAVDDFRQNVRAFRSGWVKPFQGRGAAFARTVGDATFGLQVLSARKLLGELDGVAARLEAGGTVLDVGCGTGNLLVQIGKAYAKARCIGVDIDGDSLAVARDRIAAAKMADRTELRHGTIAATIEPASIDVVTMVEVLHEIGPGIRAGVVAECAAALKPGGWMLIVDETYPSKPAQARERDFLFPLHTGFEELLWGNVLPTREEQETMLRGAGFSGEIRRSIVGEGFTVLATCKA